MPRHIDVEGYRKLFDEEYKKTRELIWEGETHLDNLAEGFSEASRVIDMMPTADVVPRAEYDSLKIELEAMRGAANSYKIHYEGLAIKICCEIEEEIVAALESNYQALKAWDDGRCNDYVLEIVNRVKGKIDALRGIEGFVEELKEKYTKGDEGK